jgi:hypothetical protein
LPVQPANPLNYKHDATIRYCLLSGIQVVLGSEFRMKAVNHTCLQKHLSVPVELGNHRSSQAKQATGFVTWNSGRVPVALELHPPLLLHCLHPARSRNTVTSRRRTEQRTCSC